MAIEVRDIKNAIKTLLSDANTTTASVNLSGSLTSQVNQVLTVNVERLPIQPSFFPYVSIFTSEYPIQLLDISRDQRAGKRVAEINFKILGAVWVDNMNSSNFELKDLADDECEILMRNIEDVLRDFPNLNLAGVRNAYPNAVTFHSFPTQEGAHMRVGLMNFVVKVQY